jgi:hypothetical protein
VLVVVVTSPPLPPSFFAPPPLLQLPAPCPRPLDQHTPEDVGAPQVRVYIMRRCIMRRCIMRRCIMRRCAVSNTLARSFVQLSLYAISHTSPHVQVYARLKCRTRCPP